MRRTRGYRRDLVLVGSGHAHVIALKMFAMQPIPDTRIYLISNSDYAPYSGMIPGYVAGYYGFDEVHFDIPRLSEQAGVTYIRSHVTGIDPRKKLVICDGRPPIEYDFLSINIGSQPSIKSIVGAGDFGTPVKPLPPFLKSLASLDYDIEFDTGALKSIVLVGGGVAGAEIALALKSRIALKRKSGAQRNHDWTITILHKDSHIASNLSAAARRKLLQRLATDGITYRTNCSVVNAANGHVTIGSGEMIPYSHLFWLTEAAGPSWLHDSGFSVTERGFIRVNPYLQALGFSDVFAAGDIAHMDASPRPKAGIFAVRQGRFLADNLRRTIMAEPLRKFQPQKNFLTILGYGSPDALATRGRIAYAGRAMWAWKQWIDRRFMARFSEIPVMKTELMELPSSKTEERIRCLGCAAKVGAQTLREALRSIEVFSGGTGEPSDPAETVPFAGPGDVAQFSVSPQTDIVQSVDMVPAMFSDLFLSGRIIALHALSDLFAVGARPHSALATCVIPYGKGRTMNRDLSQLLGGAVFELKKHGCTLIGGHTMEGSEPTLGLTCNGLMPAGINDDLSRPLTASDVIILTKPIGVGTLLRAHMLGQAKGRWIDGAIKNMLLSNAEAARILNAYCVKTRTDITGFGLGGHLRAIAPSQGVAVTINFDAIPLLPGVLECYQLGVASSIADANIANLLPIENGSPLDINWITHVLGDPQTSGGLLFAVAPETAGQILAELHVQGFSAATVIGTVREHGNCLSVVEIAAGLNDNGR